MPRFVRDLHNVLRDDVVCWQQGQLVCVTPSGFAYKQDLTQVEANQALFFLAVAEPVDLSTRNDEYATRVLKEYELLDLVEISRH